MHVVPSVSLEETRIGEANLVKTYGCLRVRQRGLPCCVFAYRARQKGCSLFTFQEKSEGSTVENRIMEIPPDKAIIPPDTAFVVKWRKAEGMVGTFEVNAWFFEQVLHSE